MPIWHVERKVYLMTAFEIVMLVIQGIAALAINAFWIGALLYTLIDRHNRIKYVEREERILRLNTFIKQHYPLPNKEMQKLKKTIRRYKLPLNRLCEGLSDEAMFDFECEFRDIPEELKERIKRDYNKKLSILEDDFDIPTDDELCD